MAATDFSQTTTTDLKGTVPDFSVSLKTTDSPSVSGETYWDSPNWTRNYGYYSDIPELHQAINAVATYTVGKGWTADINTTNRLKLITGRGEESFQSIMWNMIVVKKANGDSFAEIISFPNGGRWFNLKTLNPSSTRIVYNEKGRIIRYEELDQKGKPNRTLKPKQIFHLSNDRVANETHGTSIIDSCKWVIDARNEAMADWRRILHRSTIRILYVDEDDATKLTTLKTQYADAIKNGEVLILPAKRGGDMNMEMGDYATPPMQPFMETIRYYENFFYQAAGTPKAILGGTETFTEASSKTAVFTFDQIWMTEQSLLEEDLQKQLGIEVKFNRPTSLKDNMVQSEAANTGQLGIQPTETQVGRNE